MIARSLLLLLLSALAPAGVTASGTTLPILCYHDVRDDVVGDVDEDEHAVSTRALVEQFDWLLAHGYMPVSAEQLLAAERGESPLPPNPILLTFDDGYASFHERVLPLLRAYRFPAVVSVVGSWLEVPPDGSVDYGGRQVPRSRFLTWEQLREVAESPWVEVASHSWDLHRGLLANRRGNTQPAANSRILDDPGGDFETVDQLRRRVRVDLLHNRDLLMERLGQAPRLVAWPYGEAAGWAFDAAREAGFEASLLLGDELAHLDGGHVWQRILIQDNPSLERWVWQLRAPAVTMPIRALHVRLADLEPDGGTADDEAELSRLLERVSQLGVGAVYLDAGGSPQAANRVAWQLRTRAGVHVWLRLPDGLADDELADWASFVPVRGWLMESQAGLQRGREILARHRAVARLAVVAASVDDAVAILGGPQGGDQVMEHAVDHVIVPPPGDVDRLPAGLDPALRHRIVFHFDSLPAPRQAARQLDRIQDRGWLSLSVPHFAAEPYGDLHRWVSAGAFPYPRR